MGEPWPPGPWPPWLPSKHACPMVQRDRMDRRMCWIQVGQWISMDSLACPFVQWDSLLNFYRIIHVLNSGPEVSQSSNLHCSPHNTLMSVHSVFSSPLCMQILAYSLTFSPGRLPYSESLSVRIRQLMLQNFHISSH